MKGISKFDFDTFTDGGMYYFVVSKQRYTLEEAYEIYREECYVEPKDFDRDEITVEHLYVRHGAGIDDYGEPLVGWWLEDIERKRSCPVWAFS